MDLEGRNVFEGVGGGGDLEVEVRKPELQRLSMAALAKALEIESWRKEKLTRKRLEEGVRNLGEIDHGRLDRKKCNKVYEGLKCF